MSLIMKNYYISYHLNHSWEFCEHADPKFSLEQIVLARIEKWYKNFAITEHQSRSKDFFYP